MFYRNGKWLQKTGKVFLYIIYGFEEEWREIAVSVM
jgi:hypothetical protein